MHVSLEGVCSQSKIGTAKQPEIGPRKRKHPPKIPIVGFQPLVFRGGVIVDGEDSFCWILLVKTNISVRKLELKSVVDVFGKEDCAHVSRLFWPVWRLQMFAN